MTYKEFEKKFMKLYNQGLSTTDICEQLGENRQRGYGLIRRKGLVGHKYKSKKYTEEFLAKIKQEYLAGATVEQLENKYPDKNILVVCHGGIVRVIHSYFHDMTNEELMTWLPENCCIQSYEK